MTDASGSDKNDDGSNGADAPAGPGRAETTAGTGVLSSSHTGVEIGTQIMGTFEIVEHIATGGMGEVYRGFNIHTKEPVAIKIVLASLAHDEKILSLFQKEATVLGRLHHEAIVRYQLFTIDPTIRRACLIMEYVAGRALSDFIADGPVPLADVKLLIERLTSGLQKAHDLGVVHRDLSPDNVIVTDGEIGHAKLIDFGIAKSANFGGGTLLGGQFAGKFNYVSPEQLGRYKGVITARSDIYSLALVLAAACRGQPLDMGDSPADAVERRMGVPDLEGVYPEIRPLLERMLQPDPDARPADMDAVRAYLADPSALGALPAAVAAPVPTPARSDTVVPPPPSSQPPAFRFTAAPGTQLSKPPGADASAASLRTVVSMPPKSEASQSSAPAPSAATIVSRPPVSSGSFGDPAKPVDDSPFGPTATPSAPVAPAAAVSSAAVAPAGHEPRKTQDKGGRKTGGGKPVVPILGVLLLAAAGAGAWFSGLIGPGDVPDGPREIAAPTPDPAPAPSAPPISEEPPEATVPEPDSEPQTDLAALAPPPEEPVQAAPPAVEPAAAPPPLVRDNAAAALADEVLALAAPSRPVADPKVPGAEQRAWLEAYPLPECTFVRVSAVTPVSFEIEAFGPDVQPFIELDGDFTAAHDLEPDIGLRQIAQAQCPVLTFVEQMAPGAASPEMSLQGDVLRPGEERPLRGSLSGTDDRSLLLLLVDDRGGTYDITRLIRTGDDGEPGFLLAVRLARESGQSDLRPHLILAVATPQPLDGIVFAQGEAVTDVLGQISAQVEARGLDTATALGYFRLEQGN